jgi:hypothetical protein
MGFHYEKDGVAAGPVSAEELEQLARAGTIKPETLVWEPGMPGWRPYQTLSQPAAAPAAPPPLADGVDCAECGRRFARGEVISYGNFWVCAACKPVFFQRIKEGVRPVGALLWRSGKVMVFTVGAELPDRCVKCNAPANGRRLKRTLYYHHPAVYLLLLCNLLIFVIVALLVRKRAELRIGLCDRHLALRKRNLLISWGLALAGLIMIVAAVAYDTLWPGLTGGAVVLGSAFYGLLTTQMVSAQRIENDRAWVRGVCREYLDLLPTWSGE